MVVMFFKANKTGVMVVCLALSLLMSSLAHSRAVRDLKYGTILYDYYQQNYFSSLVGFEYAKEKGDLKHNLNDARLLKGGMALSYGLAEQAQVVFKDLLDERVPLALRNKAWFYLAKLYYQKGDVIAASRNLVRINGHVPSEIKKEYNYLATLINIRNNHLDAAQDAISSTAKSTVYEPYLRYNLAVTQLGDGDIPAARKNLDKVIAFGRSNGDEEFKVLADRAKHAQAHLSIQSKDLPTAWHYLQDVRTTGLYSNRALLTYGWTAINLGRFQEAIPALRILNNRSIAIAEVQEAKVLLASLYERQGAKRAALKNYLLAEREFKAGVEAIAGAREVISRQEIPKEFVLNLEAMMDETDWYGMEASLDYNKLTPFLIELMSSNAFHSVIKELRDLYAVRENMRYWSRQATEHQLIIERRRQGWSSQSLQQFIDESESKQEQYEEQIAELRLHTMTLDVRDQERFEALLKATEFDFDYLDDKIGKIKKIKAPYKQSEKNIQWAKSLHGRIQKEMNTSNALIKKLEVVMRKVVNAELDKHEERMKYYWAQARLGKARLYDSALNSLEQ